MNKHTPGIWKPEEFFWCQPNRMKVMAGDKEIADCGVVTGDEERANAILMATAPDLLSELETLVALLPELDDPDAEMSGSETISILAERWPDIKAVIAAATRKES